MLGARECGTACAALRGRVEEGSELGRGWDWARLAPGPSLKVCSACGSAQPGRQRRLVGAWGAHEGAWARVSQVGAGAGRVCQARCGDVSRYLPMGADPMSRESLCVAVYDVTCSKACCREVPVTSLATWLRPSRSTRLSSLECVEHTIHSLVSGTFSAYVLVSPSSADWPLCLGLTFLIRGTGIAAPKASALVDAACAWCTHFAERSQAVTVPRYECKHCLIILPS